MEMWQRRCQPPAGGAEGRSALERRRSSDPRGTEELRPQASARRPFAAGGDSSPTRSPPVLRPARPAASFSSRRGG